jgi:hypothetical protein
MAEYDDSNWYDGIVDSAGDLYDYATDTAGDVWDWATSSDSGDGNYTQTFDDGSTITFDASGNPLGSTNATDSDNGGLSSKLGDMLSSLGSSAFNTLKKVYTKKDAQGKPTTDWAALAATGVGLYGAMNPKSGGNTGGYGKPVPNLTASRQQIQYDDPNRVAGSAGRQYFTDTKYDGTDPAVQAQGITAAYQPAAATTNPYAGTMARKYNDAPMQQQNSMQPASNVSNTLPVPEAQGFNMGGIAQLAKGGRYLSGDTDGMADELQTSIDGEQAAALSHGEFVIPADVVSHLGNGNSEAGADKLYQMMAHIRKARTGSEKQGREIDPDKFIPGTQKAQSGGLMGFEGGGAVPAASAGIAPDTSKTSTLSPWVGDYVTNALGEGAAAAAQPYQAYQGPLTAGASDLQQQAFAGASETAQAGYNPTQFTSNTFGSEQANQYMNPYLKNVLDPQMAELQRQAEIQRMNDNSSLTKAGAFGGSRQAIMNSEGNRNLLNAQSTALGQGYSNAYDKGMAQFNTEQGRDMEAQKNTEQSNQYSSDFGLKSLADLSQQGQTQRAIEAEGIAADKAQFEQQRDYTMQLPQYKLNLLQGLPIGASTSSSDAGALSNLTSQVSGLASLYQTLSKLGVTS